MPASCDALLQGLFQGTPAVRRACAGILDHAPHDDRIERALTAAATDPDWKVRKAALHSLSCAECKPDGCLTTDGVGALISGMLHDPDRRVRMVCAGAMMWGQAGHTERIAVAFRQVLAMSANTQMRERAAIYLASFDVPRPERKTRE